MSNIKYYIANIVLCVAMLICKSCQMADTNPAEGLGMVAADKGTAVLSLFEEIDLIALTLVQQESPTGRLLTLLPEGFCKETLIFRNAKDKSVSADFGSGCVSTKGVKRAGVITVTNSDSFWSKGNVTKIVLNDFSVDGVKISGTRVLKNNGFQPEQRQLNFETLMERGTVTWPGEEQFVADCRQSRTIILPSQEGSFMFSLVGETEITDGSGNVLLAEIIDPVVFKSDCLKQGMPRPSSGSVAIKRSKLETVVVNFNVLCN